MKHPVLDIGETCISCDACVGICPENAILKNKKKYVIETWSCTLCTACVEICPVGAIKLIKDLPANLGTKESRRK